jgi:hypothetical protein
MFEIALINKTFVYRKSLKDLFRFWRFSSFRQNQVLSFFRAKKSKKDVFKVFLPN